MEITLRKNYHEAIPKNYTGIIEREDGSKEWYMNGKRHRIDGPAIEFLNGTKYWYIEGKIHREDGPAVEFSNGTKEWYKEGLLHREDGPAIIYLNGTKYWYVKGKSFNYYEFSLVQLAHGIFIEAEIGKHGLLWAKFMTVQGIKELPIIPGMKEDDDLKDLLVKLGI